MVGQEQNSFVLTDLVVMTSSFLNTVLEFNKSEKLLWHLQFVDLKEAYDRVDHSILLMKVLQLNVPDSFITFLRNYCFQDLVSTASGRERTRLQYQKRGLQKGVQSYSSSICRNLAGA